MYQVVHVSKGESIVRNRESIYGSPVPNLERFAKMVEGVLGVECTPLQATMIMVCLKVVRESHGGHQMDNLDDIEGYVAIARRIVDEGSTDSTSS